MKFVSEGTPITFNFLKQNLPKYADTKKRVRHTFIIVFLNKAEIEEKQIASFWTMLNTLMSKKIRSNVCDEKVQDTLRVCKTVIKKNKTEKQFSDVKLSSYRLCQISLEDLGPKTYMAYFNPQNNNAPCKYSAQGNFTLGAGLDKNREQSDMKTDWIIVNHLENSQLLGQVMDCKK